MSPTQRWIIGIVVAVVMSAGGGWMVRQDYQTVTSRDAQNAIAELSLQVNSQRLQMDRMNAYLLSSYAWQVRVSVIMKWPAPPEPRFFLSSVFEKRPEPAGGLFAAEK